jgi:hypothetical protein
MMAPVSGSGCTPAWIALVANFIGNKGTGYHPEPNEKSSMSILKI